MADATVSDVLPAYAMADAAIPYAADAYAADAHAADAIATDAYATTSTFDADGTSRTIPSFTGATGTSWNSFC